LQYYLITKYRYFENPTLGDLKNSLKSMKSHCASHSVKALAMPRIGCGLDGLMWPDVKNAILDIFDDLDLTITIYTLK